VAGGGPAASILAGLVCERVAGLHLGGQIAAGSYGRVYKGTYFGSKVCFIFLWWGGGQGGGKHLSWVTGGGCKHTGGPGV
jgi:hypothetical protein